MDSKSTSRASNFPILKVIQNYIKTTQKGINHWAVCPFHQDSNPSLSISQEKNIFKCFSCNVSGDPISFVMRIEKCGYSAAIIKIAKILNLNPDDYLSKAESSNHKLYRINDLIASSYHRYLFNKESKRYLDYLTKTRELTLEIIEKYKLGFAPEKDILQSVFKSYLDRHTNEKFGDEEYKKLGIYVYGPSGTKDPFFTKRIIFPILNKDSQIVGFGGRSIDGEVPKYLNVKTGVLFKKKDSVFNINNLKEGNPIYIYEGFIDLLKTEMCGIKNGIACMGSSLNPGIFETLHKFSRDIIFCFDNDVTGQEFTISTCSNMINHGFCIKVVDLLDSSYKDIDEFLGSTEKEKAISNLQNPVNFFSWLWKAKSKKQNLQDPIAFQLFISESLDYLFLHQEEHISLKPNVDISFANECIKVIFGFYKNIPEFQAKNHVETIAKQQKRYEEAAMRALIEKGKPRNTNIVVQETSDQKDISEIKNPLFQILVKYLEVLLYLRQNHQEIVGSHKKSWFFEIPEKYVDSFFESKLYFTILKKCLSAKPIKLTSEEEAHIEEWKKYRTSRVQIVSIEEFFNQFFSMNKSYITCLIEFCWKEGIEDLKERWIRNMELKDLAIKHQEHASDFFKSFSFSKDAED